MSLVLLTPPQPLRSLLGYGLAIGSVLATLLTYAVLGPVAQQSPLVLFLAAVVLTALYGGLGPGLLATGLSLGAILAFLGPGFGPLALDTPERQMRVALFIGTALLINVLSQARTRAEQATREQRARLQVTLASIGDAVIATDTAGRITFMNAVAETLTGWPAAAALGQDLAQVFVVVNAQSRAPVESPASKVLRTGQIAGLANHTILVARDGREKPIDDSGAPIRDAHGVITGVVLVFRDITARAQAEAERTRLLAAEQTARAQAEAGERSSRVLAAASAALASSLDYETTMTRVAELAVPELADWCGVDVLDEDGVLAQIAVAHVDPAKIAWARELRQRYPPEPGVPSGILTVLQTGQSQFVPAISDDTLAAAARDADHLALMRTVGFTSLIIVPLQVHNRILGTLSLVSAESHRHYTEADLRLAEDLGRRAAVAIENARLYRAAQEAIRMRDQFVSVASHELKTPLTSLLGYAQLLQRRVQREGILDGRDLRALQLIGDQARRLDRMVLSLLDISRIESGQLSIEHGEVDLAALARRLVDEVQPTLERHTLRLDVPRDPLLIAGDALRLEQVLQNLLQNAVKYSPQGGTIDLAVTRRDDTVCLSVRDPGIGIPPAALPQLFQRFYRAPNAEARHIGGIGLGLYVVQEIVTLHGGHIDVTSQEGAGSTFTLCFPALEEIRDER